MLPQIIQAASYIEYDHSIIPTLLNEDTSVAIRHHLTEIFKGLYVICRSLEQKYRTETINTFVKKCCSNYIDNQKGMINSILERSRRTIVFDRVLITDSITQAQTLVTDPDALATYVNHHFQNVAGGSQGFKTLPTRWAHRYLPIDRIQSSWYDDILQPPTQEEWSDILRTFPLGKAAGPSGISNEMLRQIGSHINSAL